MGVEGDGACARKKDINEWIGCVCVSVRGVWEQLLESQSTSHQMKKDRYDGFRGGRKYEALFSHIKCRWRLGSLLKIMDVGQRSTYQEGVLVSNLLRLAPLHH